VYDQIGLRNENHELYCQVSDIIRKEEKKREVTNI